MEEVWRNDKNQFYFADLPLELNEYIIRKIGLMTFHDPINGEVKNDKNI